MQVIMQRKKIHLVLFFFPFILIVLGPTIPSLASREGDSTEDGLVPAPKLTKGFDAQVRGLKTLNWLPPRAPGSWVAHPGPETANTVGNKEGKEKENMKEGGSGERERERERWKESCWAVTPRVGAHSCGGAIC